LSWCQVIFAVLSNHRITITDPAGFKQEYHYDGYHRETYFRDPAMLAAVPANEMHLHPEYHASIRTDLDMIGGKGVARFRYLEGADNSTRVLARHHTWDNNLRLPTSTETREGTTATTYHPTGPSIGLPSEIRLPKHEAEGDDYKITFTYSGREIETIKRHLGGVEKTLAAFTWYANRDLHTATDALGRTLTYEWNADGRPKKVTDGTTGDILEIFYHATTLRPETIKLNGTTLHSTTHDAIGRVLSQTGPDGGVSQFTYDALDRLTSATGSDGLTTRWFWACCFIEEIRRTKTTAGQERVLDRVRYTHDPRGLVTSTTDTAGSRLQYTYEAGGNLATLTDAAGNTTTWEHDEFGRLRKKTYPDLTYEEYDYFTIHSTAPWTSVNRRGQTTIISRDEEEKPTSIDAGGAEIIEFAYDTWNRLQSVTQSGGELPGTHTFAYDLLGRTTSIDGPWTDDTLTWTYNDANRQVTRTATGAEGPYSETTTTDAFGRIASMLNPLGTFTWNYTGTDPRPGSITHSGGFNTEFKYATLNNGGRLTELISKLPGGATISKHSYTHDTLGQIATWKREAPLANPGTTHQYEWTLAHDFSGQLTSVIEKDLNGGLRDSWAFGYDAAGNRSSATRSGAPGTTAKAMTASHNTMNQITSLGGGGRTVIAGSLNEPGQVSVGLAGQTSKPARMLSGNRFESDLDLPAGTSTLEITANDPTGNTTSKQYSIVTAPETARTTTHDADGNMTSDGVRTYEWDTWSRLTKITWASGKTTTFHYNALGQRAKILHVDGTTTRTEYFLYDGPGPIQRRTGGTSASNTDRVYFSQGERRKVGSTWTNHFYTRDHLGSVREVLDTSGSLLARHDYAPYGERTTRYEASGYEGTDFAFTGHFLLPSPVPGQSEILLAHYRAYDPVLGRWLSQDPIREAGGINLYGYVGGRVVDWSDPLGLLPSVVMRYVNDPPKTDAEIRGVVCGASVGPAIIATVISGPAVVGVRGLIMRNPGNVAKVTAALDETGVLVAGAAGAAAVTTKLANQGADDAIRVTFGGMFHVWERHMFSGVQKFRGKSKFNIGEDVLGLIRKAAGCNPIPQANGRLQRTFDVGRNIGIDRTTGQQTSIMTVITNKDGTLVTAFPGRP
jgi:RHS repeat-associated protein